MSNVFNQGKTDYSVPKLFLGEPNGLMDTVHNHYPKIESLYRKLKSLDWSDQEFDFSSCVTDFQTCSKSTYDMMIRTLAWQWEADSIVAHSISPVAAPFVSNSQLWTAWCEVTKNECLTPEHEVLTSTGWKNIDKVNTSDLVAQWDYNTHSIDFVNPTGIVEEDYRGDMYLFTGSRGNVLQKTTPGHRMPIIYPYWSTLGKKEFLFAKDVNYNGGNALPTSGYINGPKKELTDLERLFIAVQADGSLSSEAYTGERTGYRRYKFGFKKKRKIERLIQLCERLNFTYSLHNTKLDLTLIYVKVPVEYYRDDVKDFNWFQLDEISHEWAESFLEELSYWDGYRANSNRVIYTTTNRSSAMIVSTLAHLCGKRGKIYETGESYGFNYTSLKTVRRKNAYQVTITNAPYVTGNSFEKKTEYYEGKVYCLQVPSTYFIVRNKNVIGITGNCTHSLTYSEIVRNSFNNPEDVFKDILAVQESFSRLGVIDSIMSNCSTVGHKLGLKLIDRDSKEAYDAAFMFVVALLILERLQFIASFAITFSIVESGQFIEIGTAVQKIAQDEIEIHAELDKEILRTELTTERGLETFNRLTPLIKESIDSVVNNEATWVKYLFSEGRELPGVTEELVNDWVKWNAQEIYDFFNIDSGYERLTRNPLPFMDSWLKNNNQPSPQEQTSASYLLGAVVDNVRDEALDFDL